MIKALFGLGDLIVKGGLDWLQGRQRIAEAKLNSEIAKIEAEAELAAYKLKADVEWDLAWAGQAESSWKDEYLLFLFTIPLWGLIIGLFLPDARPAVMETLDWLKAIHPMILEFYLGALAVIVSAVYGVRAFAQGWLPGRVARIAEAFGELDDDIPDQAVEAATTRVQAFIDRQRQSASHQGSWRQDDPSAVVPPPQPN